MAVLGGPLGDLALTLDRGGDGREDLAEPLQPEPLARLREELELQLGGELEPRADRVGRRLGVRGRRLDVGARQLDESPEERERLLDVVRRRWVVPVDDGLHGSRLEAAALGQLEELEAIASLDDDVEPPVLEPVGDLDHGRERPDLPDPVVVGVDEPEGALLVDALGDQLAVARLEDVEGDLLGREQDEPERKEADLVHRRSLSLRAGTRRAAPTGRGWRWPRGDRGWR